MAAQQRVVRDNTYSPLPRPWIVSAILAVVLAVTFGLNLLANATTVMDQSSASSFTRLALNPISVEDGQVWRLATAGLLHTNIVCLLATLLTLIVVGSEVESRWGVSRYIVTLGILALATSAAVMYAEPQVSRFALGVPNALGLVGAALVVSRRAGFRVWAVLGVGVLDIVAYLVFGIQSSAIALFAGGITGALVASLLIIAPHDRRRNKYQGTMMIGLAALLAVAILIRILMK